MYIIYPYMWINIYTYGFIELYMYFFKDKKKHKMVCILRKNYLDSSP